MSYFKPRRFGYGVLQIITVAFLLFLAPAGGSNPAGPIVKPCEAI